MKIRKKEKWHKFNKQIALLKFANSCNQDDFCIHRMTNEQIVTAFNHKIIN